MTAYGSHVTAYGSHVTAYGSHVTADGSHVTADGSHVTAYDDHVTCTLLQHNITLNYTSWNWGTFMNNLSVLPGHSVYLNSLSVCVGCLGVSVYLSIYLSVCLSSQITRLTTLRI